MTGPTQDEPRVVVRNAARVLLVDAAERVLLFRADLGSVAQQAESQGTKRRVWITPGGGLHPGETPEEGARRELWEETGIEPAGLSPCVWLRTHRFPWKGYVIEQRESYFLARASSTSIADTNWTVEERVMLVEHRWWELDGIAASPDIFVPKRLAAALPSLLAGDYPLEPIDIGV